MKLSSQMQRQRSVEIVVGMEEDEDEDEEVIDGWMRKRGGNRRNQSINGEGGNRRQAEGGVEVWQELRW